MSTKMSKNRISSNTGNGTIWNAAVKAQAAGDYPAAEKLYKNLLKKHPGHREAQHNLAFIAQQQGDYVRAEHLYDQITGHGTPNAKYHSNYSGLLVELGKYEAAASHALKAIHADAKYAAAYNNLGAALEKTGHLDQAMVCYKNAMTLDPNDFHAYSNLGSAFRLKDDRDSALACYRQAVTIQPNHANPHLNLATVLIELNEPEAAAQHLIEALRLDPDMSKAYNNLGEALKRLGKLEAARAALRIAIRQCNDSPDARWNLALVELATGELARGWDLYEEGITAKQRRPFDFGVPYWDGSSLEGKSVVVVAEQGLGDEILFASCLPDLIPQASRCMITCDSRLEPLFARSFLSAEVFPSREPERLKELAAQNKFDYQLPIASLPRHFRRSLEQFPETAGYLLPDPDKAQTWKQRLEQLPPGIKIGVNWRSTNRHVTRQRAFLSLDELLPIFAVPGATFVNLQYDECQSELDYLRDTHGFVLHNFDDLDQFNDLDGVAALMSQLDLVICVSTAVGQMGGALGIPILKFLLSYEWTTLGTDNEPWYPNVHVLPLDFNDRGKLIELVKQNLLEMIATNPGPAV